MKKYSVSILISISIFAGFFFFQNCAKYDSKVSEQSESDSLSDLESRIANGIPASVGNKDLLTTVVFIYYKPLYVIPNLVITKNIGANQVTFENTNFKTLVDKINTYITAATTAGINNFTPVKNKFLTSPGTDGVNCSGTLYDQTKVITAAHCIQTTDDRRAGLISHFENFKLYFTEFLEHFKKAGSICQNFDKNCIHFNYFSKITSIDLVKDNDNSTISGIPLSDYADVILPYIYMNPAGSIKSRDPAIYDQTITVQSTQVFQHPLFKTKNMVHDLGLIKLPNNNDITNRSDIHYVEKPTEMQLDSENLASQLKNLRPNKWLAAGYGIFSSDLSNEENINKSTELRYAELKSPIDLSTKRNIEIASNEFKFLPYFNNFLDLNSEVVSNKQNFGFNVYRSAIFKYKTKESSGVLQGDSGGPVYFYKTSADGKTHFIQIAVNSWGTTGTEQDDYVGGYFMGWILNENDWQWINDPEFFTGSNLKIDLFDMQMENTNISTNCSYFASEKKENRIEFGRKFSVHRFKEIFTKNIYARKAHNLKLDLNSLTQNIFDSQIKKYFGENDIDRFLNFQINVEHDARITIIADKFTNTSKGLKIYLNLNYEKSDVEFLILNSSLVLKNNKTNLIIATVNFPNTPDYINWLFVRYSKSFTNDNDDKQVDTEYYTNKGTLIHKDLALVAAPTCVINACTDTNADPISCHSL